MIWCWCCFASFQKVIKKKLTLFEFILRYVNTSRFNSWPTHLVSSFCSVHRTEENFNKLHAQKVSAEGGSPVSAHMQTLLQDAGRTEARKSERAASLQQWTTTWKSCSVSRSKVWTLCVVLLFRPSGAAGFYSLRPTGAVFPMMLGYLRSVRSTLWIQCEDLCRNK